MQTSHLAIFAALSGLLVAGPASAQSCDLDVLQPVPPMTQRPEVVDFSADGSVALLQAPIDIFSGNYTHTFLWTKGEGYRLIDYSMGYYFMATCISPDGSVTGGIGQEMFAGGPERAYVDNFGYIDNGGYEGAYLADLSSGGAVGVGSTSWPTRPFRWTPSTGLVELPLLAGGDRGKATGVSPDGQFVVGESVDTTSVSQAVLWDLSGPIQSVGPANSSAVAVSNGGQLVAGNTSAAGQADQFFVWTPAGGTTTVPLPAGYASAEARKVSLDGTAVIGIARGAGNSTDRPLGLFRWTASGGYEFTNECATPPSGVRIGVADDGEAWGKRDEVWMDAGVEGIASIEVLRMQFERQISDTIRVPYTTYPWGMDLAVVLENGADPLSPNPSVAGPIALQEPFLNGGVLGYNPEEEWHNIGSGGTGWGTTSEAEIDALFGTGTYQFQIDGSSTSLRLQTVFPFDAPLLTPVHVGNGGVWLDEKYYFNSGADHTVAVSPFAEFGFNVEDAIAYSIAGCGYQDEGTFLASQGGPNQLIIDIPAASMALGTDFVLEVSFISASDVNYPFAGVRASAAYEKSTTMIFQVISEGTAFGTDYCDGGGAQLVATGYPFVGPVAQTNLVASGLPASTVGFFIVSRDQGFVPNPGGCQGNLCLSGAIGRIYNGSGAFATNSCGTIRIGLNPFNAGVILPQPGVPGGTVTIQPGETWNFQAWYRDDPPPNFTNGLSVTFQ